MHSKGLAPTAVFRSSGFQIYFLGLSKLVAAKSPAPECGRYIFRHVRLKPASVSVVIIATLLWLLLNAISCSVQFGIALLEFKGNLCHLASALNQFAL
jgi:hypothetical protein